MKSNIKPQHGGFTLVELLVVIVIIVTLAGLSAPAIIRMTKKGPLMVAINNGKNMVMALTEFSTEYGNFPDKETAKAVTDKTGSTLNLNGDTANDYFRQLIASGMTKSEEPFFATSSISTKKPDNIMTGSECLKGGEVGFGYIMNGMSAIEADTNRIIAVTPLLNNSAKGEFDANPLDGKAVFVGLDSSVKTYVIRQDNKKVVVGSKTLLETGEGTIWGSDIKPVIKVPKKK
ncbi:MAG: prepilin-type N-terminal cleavage/methylation domain-containing protein [Verrucomicrobia bacterium]|nr:MAG: prepilin-type N-terminal cleavage/methylation domain-containing protein [Verrucomicrobiota bacterium]